MRVKNSHSLSALGICVDSWHQVLARHQKIWLAAVFVLLWRPSWLTLKTSSVDDVDPLTSERFIQSMWFVLHSIKTKKPQAPNYMIAHVSLCLLNWVKIWDLKDFIPWDGSFCCDWQFAEKWMSSRGRSSYFTDQLLAGKIRLSEGKQ